jgi:hypothetical protein
VQHALLTDGTAFDVDADDAEQEVSDRLRLGHGRRRLGQEHAALELLERLAALVPPPRRPLLAYHGVLAPNAEWRSAIVPTPASDAARAGAGARSPRRWAWASLLRRVFAIQVLVCDRCGGPRRILGAVTEPPAVRRFLAALGLAADGRRASPLAVA